MPSFVVALYSVVFKLWLRHKLLSSSQPISSDAYGSLSRPSGHGVPANASFVDGVASKDLHIDPLTSLSLRIFLPQSALPQDQISHPGKTGLFGFILRQEEPEQGVDGRPKAGDSTHNLERTGAEGTVSRGLRSGATDRYLRLDDKAILDEDSGNEDLFVGENSAKGQAAMDDRRESGQYRGYLPGVSASAHQKLPIVVQFHAGAFVTGSNDSFANDAFCRKIAKLCDAIVVAVGYRLAPEHKYPAAFDDGFEALSWLSKQANLAECSKSLGHIPSGYDRSGSDNHRIDLHRELVDSFGASVVEPWLAAHGDFSRCVVLGVSCGSNIADHVARKAIQAGKMLDPVKVVAQVLMYPFFIGSIPTPSEIKLSNAYFYDKTSCILAWKLLLPDGEFNPDHPVANPLIPGKQPPLKKMPPTLTVVAELDWMKDRAIAYSEALRKANVDAPVLEYKDAVHEFATLDYLVNSPQAEACAEDITIWMKKYISLRGHEFSY